MKTSKALYLARRRIKSQEQCFVCDALNACVLWDGVPTDLCDKLKKTIAVSLNGQFSVNEWLNRKGLALGLNMYSKELRDYRLRWIDWMIEGYKKVGD